MNGRLLALLAGVLAFPWSTPAQAWGDIGHQIICEIAFQELEPTARERVKAMIRRAPRVRHLRRGLHLARSSPATSVRTLR